MARFLLEPKRDEHLYAFAFSSVDRRRCSREQRRAGSNLDASYSIEILRGSGIRSIDFSTPLCSHLPVKWRDEYFYRRGLHLAVQLLLVDVIPIPVNRTFGLS